MSNLIDKKEANRAMYISGAVIILVIMGLFTNGFGFFNRDKDNDDLTLSIGNAPVLGSVNAPVTIYEFSDFSCPACALASGAVQTNDAMYVAPMPEIKKKYVNSGKVKIVFKYFPGHGQGQAAQLVGWCLNEQELFWEFHDEVFANQEQANNLTAMKMFAEGLEADMGALIAVLQTILTENFLLKTLRWAK